MRPASRSAGTKCAFTTAPKAQSATSGGVTYAGYDQLPDNRIDVGIVWRRPGLFHWLLRGLRMNRLYLWLHDAIDASRFEPMLGVFRKVMVLSRFHRLLYADVPSRKGSNDLERNRIRTIHRVRAAPIPICWCTGRVTTAACERSSNVGPKFAGPCPTRG